MADPRFFKKSKNFTVREIAVLTDCDIKGASKADLILEDLAPLANAGSNNISFLDNAKYKSEFKKTKAGACFISEEMLKLAPSQLTCLVTKNPYKAFAITAQHFYPERLSPKKSKVAKSASIAKTAKISKNVQIDQNVVIGDNAEIGEGTWIEANVVIHDNVQIGKHCRIGSNSTVSHAIIGDYTRLYPGVCVGQDGFGFAIDVAGHVKVPQLGRVIIEDHVEIGANTTIDRGSGPDTVIGQGTWIDNLVQIAHNVKIGKGCVIAGQAGVSGSSVLEDYVIVGGQAGIAGHFKVGKGARIGGQSGVMGNLEGGEDYFGTPAIPKIKHFRQLAEVNRLIKKRKKD
ncbi:MAG: UDP-3-O-(3-hydroxymyristoyl)glucosamine N-acyltransferase [Alphaproteobacteria bacterium]|nr:UDP-3-O-(3-hydroxymyristoyl)glucosamine N-acyltransferase [Alphaproteobacteria bacterium]